MDIYDEKIFKGNMSEFEHSQSQLDSSISDDSSFVEFSPGFKTQILNSPPKLKEDNTNDANVHTPENK